MQVQLMRSFLQSCAFMPVDANALTTYNCHAPQGLFEANSQTQAEDRPPLLAQSEVEVGMQIPEVLEDHAACDKGSLHSFDVDSPTACSLGSAQYSSSSTTEQSISHGAGAHSAGELASAFSVERHSGTEHLATADEITAQFNGVNTSGHVEQGSFETADEEEYSQHGPVSTRNSPRNGQATDSMQSSAAADLGARWKVLATKCFNGDVTTLAHQLPSFERLKAYMEPMEAALKRQSWQLLLQDLDAQVKGSQLAVLTTQVLLIDQLPDIAVVPNDLLEQLAKSIANHGLQYPEDRSSLIKQYNCLKRHFPSHPALSSELFPAMMHATRRKRNNRKHWLNT